MINSSNASNDALDCRIYIKDKRVFKSIRDELYEKTSCIFPLSVYEKNVFVQMVKNPNPTDKILIDETCQFIETCNTLKIERIDLHNETRMITIENLSLVEKSIDLVCRSIYRFNRKR